MLDAKSLDRLWPVDQAAISTKYAAQPAVASKYAAQPLAVAVDSEGGHDSKTGSASSGAAICPRSKGYASAMHSAAPAAAGLSQVMNCVEHAEVEHHREFEQLLQGFKQVEKQQEKMAERIQHHFDTRLNVAVHHLETVVRAALNGEGGSHMKFPTGLHDSAEVQKAPVLSAGTKERMIVLGGPPFNAMDAEACRADAEAEAEVSGAAVKTSGDNELGARSGKIDSTSSADAPGTNKSSNSVGQGIIKRFDQEEDEKKAKHLEQSKLQSVVISHGEKFMFTQDELLTRLKSIGTDPHFDGLCAVVLLSNAVFIGFQVDYSLEERTSVVPDAYEYLDYCYTFWFCIEVILRIVSLGLKNFFRGEEHSWNIFDSVIVSFGIFEVGLSWWAVDQASLLSNVSALRTIRIARVARIARVIRLMRFFRSLRILVKAILCTMKSCLWTALLLCMIIYIFAIIFAQGVADHFNDGRGRYGRESEALRIYFGTLPRAIFTGFKAIQGGLDWEPIATALSDLNWFYVAVFVLQIAFVNLAVLNVISGLFLQGALEQAQADLNEQIATHVTEKTTYVQRFQDVFAQMDHNGDEGISFGEFQTSLETKKMKDLLNAMEIEADDAWTLFKLLDIDSSGSVDLREFVNGCIQLKGAAKSIHIAQQTYQVRWMMDAFQELAVFIENNFSGFEQHLEAVELEAYARGEAEAAGRGGAGAIAEAEAIATGEATAIVLD